MKEIDVLLSNPRHVDYPLFRYNLKWFKPYFKTVYIALTQDTIPPDITNAITQSREYEGVHWVRPARADGTNDWRDVAVKDMITNFAHSDYILFLEQDFLIRDQRFFDKIFEALDKYDFIYYQEGERIHPAFALIRRDSAMNSTLDFSVKPTYDHFYSFFNSLPPFMERTEIRDIGLVEKEDFYHMAGLTNNYHVFKLGQPFYKPQEFLAYNYHCNRLPITPVNQFYELCQKIEADCGKGEAEGFIKNFFPPIQ
jgi:hypothetical protein